MGIQTDAVELRKDSIFVYRDKMRMRCWRHPADNCSILCPMLRWSDDHVLFFCVEHGNTVVVSRKPNEEDQED